MQLVPDGMLSAVRGTNFISSITASAASTVNFTGLSTTYNEYVIKMWGVIPGTDAVSLLSRVSTDGGSTYHSASTDYQYGYTWVGSTGSTGVIYNNAGDSVVIASAGVSNVAARTLSGEFHVYQPWQTVNYTQCIFSVIYRNATPQIVTVQGGGTYQGNNVNAIQFLMSSGTISGTFALYGILN